MGWENAIIERRDFRVGGEGVGVGGGESLDPAQGRNATKERFTARWLLATLLLAAVLPLIGATGSYQMGLVADGGSC